MSSQKGNGKLRKSKIILFSGKTDPKSYESTLSRTPLSLLAISSFLAQEEYEIHVISATPRYNYRKKILELIDDATICIGITSMTGYQIREGLDISELIKNKYPTIPIVWGGWHPSICPTQTIENKFIDVVVIGQGERTFTELVHALENGSSLNKISGIVYKKNGHIIENLPRPFEDINNFPPLPYHLLDLNEYLSPTEMGLRTISYLSSQGCPFRCAFCVEQRVNKGRWSGLNPQRVLDDIESLVEKYGVDAIELADSNFFSKTERVKQICEGIIERKLNIKWGNANGRTEKLVKLDEYLWELMKKSGCYGVLIGAESGSQAVLDSIHKDAKVEDTIEVAKLCKKYNLKITFSFMTGFPPAAISEEVAEIELDKTLNLIDKILEIKNSDNTIFISIYAPYPGTPLYEFEVKQGFEEPKDLAEWSEITHDVKKAWLSEDKHKLVKQLDEYIFPYIPSDYQKRHNPTFRPIHTLFHYIASIRWKYKCFSFPIDYMLFKFLRNLTR